MPTTTTSPLDCAIAAAPLIDRARLAIARGIAAQASPGDQSGLNEPAAAMLAMLRHTLPDRAVTADQLRTVYAFHRDDQYTATQAELSRAGLIRIDDDWIRLTDQGRVWIERLWRISDDVVTDLWDPVRDHVDALETLIPPVVARATAAPGPALSVFTPILDRPDSSSSTRVAERLTQLRFHRFDAHVAAWRAAGTPPMDDTLPPGMREQIEDETNRRAATAYEPISPHQRTNLLVHLASLATTAGGRL
jgi:hypothetical protein